MILKVFSYIFISLFLLDENPDPRRFEHQILAYDSLNRLNMPDPGAFVFYGSSSIAMWKTLSEDFKNFPVINRGFGGSHMSDAIYYFNRVVIPFQPEKIIIYEGDNDVAAGKSPKQILKDLKTFYRMVHKKMPGAELGILAAKPSPSRWEFKKSYEATNKLFKDYCNKKKALTFIDVYNPMLNNKGFPDPAYYIQDSLHLSSQGYKLWADIVRPFIEK